MEQLKKNSTEEGADFFIVLGGYLKSSKRIQWFEEDRIFSVYNEIDDSMQELTEEQMMDEDHTLIGKAMGKCALFKY